MNADQVLKRWGECLNSYDLVNIVNLYSSDAVLWGTFSKIIRNDSRLIEQYFEGLFQKDSLNVNFSSINPRVYSDTHFYSGTYEFSYVEKRLIIFPCAIHICKFVMITIRGIKLWNIIPH